MKRVCHNCVSCSKVVLRAQPKRPKTKAREASLGRALGKAPMCSVQGKHVCRQDTCADFAFSPEKKKNKPEENKNEKAKQQQESKPRNKASSYQAQAKGSEQGAHKAQEGGKSKAQGRRRPRREERRSPRQEGRRQG